MNFFEGLHIKLDLKCYPHSVFFFKEDRCWMEYDWKNGYFGCRYEGFWDVLGKEKNLAYSEVRAFIKGQVEEHFKLKGIIPKPQAEQHFKLVEQHFNEIWALSSGG